MKTITITCERCGNAYAYQSQEICGIDLMARLPKHCRKCERKRTREWEQRRFERQMLINLFSIQPNQA